MAYYDAIANAIGARGNALAQGALQSGQVWGNLAANLGQIPGQAIAYHQQRQDALQNHELKKMALEKAQRKAEIEKGAIRIANSGLPQDQMDLAYENLLRGDPEEYQNYLTAKMQREMRQQQQLVSYNATRQNTPGTVAPQGGYALPMPTRGETVPGGGVGNAFEPVTPIAEQMVHPTLQSAYGPLNAQTAAQVQGRKDVTAETTAARQLKNQMALEKFKASLKPDTFATQTRPDKDPTSSTGWTLKLFNRETGQYDIPTGLESPPPMSTLPGAGQPPSQFAGFNQEGKPVAFVPGKGSAGRLAEVPGGQGPLSPKVTQPLSTKDSGALSSTINSLQLIKQIKSLIPETHTDIPFYNIPKGIGQKMGVKVGFEGPEQQFTDVTDKLKLSAQEIIKGAPSNFDVQTFISTLAALGQGKAQALNKTQLAEDQLTNALIGQIRTIQARRQAIPDEILEGARSLGINVDGGAPGGGGGGNITPEAAAAELARRKQAKAGKK